MSANIRIIQFHDNGKFPQSFLQERLPEDEFHRIIINFKPST